MATSEARVKPVPPMNVSVSDRLVLVPDFLIKDRRSEKNTATEEAESTAHEKS
jgi:hypothetical protein